MALLDLSSDLSRFRSEVSREPKNTPESSKATNNKNFATFQPITEKLSTFSPTINKTEPKQLESKLGDTRLDDIRKLVMENLLINSVSRYGDINLSYREESLGRISTEQIASRFNKLNTEEFTTRLDKSNILVVRQNVGTNNTTSPIDIQINKDDARDNITNPNVQVEKSQLTFDRTASSPNIKVNPNDASDNITNPDVQIEQSQLTFDRTSTSPNIVVNKNDAVDNITNPNVQLDSTPLTFDRTKSSPQIVVNPNDSTDNITNPNTQIEVPSQIIDRSKTSPNIVINKNDAIDNITNPDVEIEVPVQSIDRSKQTVNINADLFSPINNVINPNIALDSTQLIFDRENQSPNIITETIQEGLVVNPNTKVFRMENGTLHLKDESRLNPDGRPIRFLTTSRLVTRRPEQDVDIQVYDQQSNQLKDNSRLNVDSVVKTNPSGRNEDPSRSKFAVIGTQAVNFFPDTNGIGFTTKPQKGASAYTDTSEYSWKGNRNAAPATNFILDTNGVGFKTFVTNGETLYKNETSIYGFSKIPETDFFDVAKKNTSEGFKSFVTALQSAYQPDSSRFTWGGNKQGAPEVNYFDLNGTNTNAGFHKFAQLYDSKYINESSQYDWEGTRQSSPEVDKFDLTRSTTSKGFERLTPSLITRYVRDASVFTFKGNNQTAPEIDTLDLTKQYAEKGFEKFAQRLDSKYVRDISVFGFVGPSRNAPTTDFFPNENGNGFTSFPQKLETEYVKDSSEFTFKGTTPTPIDFFPNDAADGFTNKVGPLESKYKKEVSRFTFVGTTPKPIDFFDNRNGKGFTIKIGKNESKYVADSSAFTFKGTSKNAPEVNYFEDTVNTGFNTFPPGLETEYKKDISRYTFVGTRQNAPSVDYFPNDSARGFTTLVNSLETSYDKNTSRFTWVGTRQDAPAVDFFTISGNKQGAITGFDTLFEDNTKTKYSDSYSRFSIESSNNKSTVKNVPFTNFFGYRPAERSGFMVNMSTFDGTLYPIIEPKLRYNDNSSTRFSVANVRGTTGGLTTSGLETYAPLSLGKRPWVDGTLAASLDNQVPNIKTKAPAGSYNNKYERGVKDNTERQGYLTKWAITRRSPSPLDEQYNKYKLQQESTNREVAAFNQPFVVRGIQRDGEVENQRWGFGVTFDDGIIRGGAVTQAERIAMDVVRLGKWTASIKGGLFNIKQLGLQAMNPAVDVDPNTPTSGVFGVSSTLLFNPLTLLGNVATARAGVHLARHGLFPFDSSYLNRYEIATTNRELRQRFSSSTQRIFENLERPLVAGQQTSYNRLIGLMKELLPNTFSPSTSDDGSKDVGNVVKNILGKREIARISSNFGGAQSFLGIGGTTMRRSTHPYLVIYNTAPNLQKQVANVSNLLGAIGNIGGGIGAAAAAGLSVGISQQQPQYEDSAKRDVFFAYNYRYSDYYKGDGNNYNGFLMALDKALRDVVSETKPTGVTRDTIEKIKKLKPYDPADRHFSSRAQSTTAQNADSHRNDAYILGENVFFSGSSATYAEAYKSSGLTIKGLSYELEGPREPNTTEVGSEIKGVQEDVVTTIRGKKPFSFQYRLASDRVTRVTSLNSETQLDVSKSFDMGPQVFTSDMNRTTQLGTDSIQKYRTLAYNKLSKVRPGEPNRISRFNDFRYDLELSGSESFITNPKVARYATRNVEDFIGLGKEGKPGAQRNLPFVSNIYYSSTSTGVEEGAPDAFKTYSIPKVKANAEFRGDRINIIDYKRANFKLSKDLVYERGKYNEKGLPGSEDFVEFYFSSIVLSGHNNCPAEVIVFRATFDTINDNHKPSWNSVKYMGRADPLYVYQGYERSISFGFTVHIGSRDEMKASWRKLNYLASWTAPEYTKAGFIRGPLIRLNIGNLYRKMPGYLGSLSYTFDNQQSTWETAKLLEDQRLDGANKGVVEPGVLQLPKTIQVSCEFVPVGVYRPEFRGVMYSLYDDTNGGNLENGLIPSDDNKVNYFRTYDQISMADDNNRGWLTVPPGTERIIDEQTGSIDYLSTTTD